MDTPKQSALLSFSFGLVTLVLAVVLTQILPSSAELAPGFNTPIIAFEFARSANDVAFLANETLREAMRLGLYWDMAFPIAYSMFLCLCVLRHLIPSSRTVFFVFTLTVLTIAADYYENYWMLVIIDGFEQQALSEQQFNNLYVATWIKWILISAFIAIAGFFYKGKLSHLLKVMALTVVSVSLLALILDSPAAYVELMAQLVGAYFALHFLYEAMAIAVPNTTPSK